MKNIFSLIVLLALTSSCTKETPMTTRDYLLEEVEDNNTPSVNYILFNKDSIITAYHYGTADIATRRQVDETTTYNCFSTTKTFTALAILQLAEQKKLDIDRPAKDYLPSFPYSSQITVRQLLSHSAGIPNPMPLDWIHLASEHKDFDRNAFFANIFKEENETNAEPNEEYAYSNLGYVLLGQMIEHVSGMTYEEYVTKNIIDKLGLAENELGFVIGDTSVYATGYHKKASFSNLALGFLIDKSKFMGELDGKWRPFNKYYINGTSYGGLIGTPRAFVKYVQELMRPNSALLSDQYKKMLFTENVTSDHKPSGMCLSWFKGELGGKSYYAHAGGGGGYYCEVRIYPDAGIGSVIFFNRTGMSDDRFLDNVDKLYFEKHQ